MAMYNQVKTVLLLGALTGILLLIGFLMGGTSGLTIALILSVFMNFGSYWFSDKIVLAMYKAKEADKHKYAWLHSAVEDVAKKAKVPKPKIYIVPSPISNAFATGRNPENAVVAVTEGIMHSLTKEELKGVIAHEIAHVKNRDILISTIAATIAGVIAYVAFFARFAAIFGGMGRDRGGGSIIGLLVMAIIAPIMAMLIQFSISRSREFLADASGARFLGDGKSLASALEKLHDSAKKMPIRAGGGVESTAHMFIVNPLSAGGIARLFSTHPKMEERVSRLRAMKF